MKKFIWILVVLVIILGAWLFFMKGSQNTSISNLAGPRARCGGNMVNAPLCTTGYHCAPEPGSRLPFGDVGGVCVKD